MVTTLMRFTRVGGSS